MIEALYALVFLNDYTSGIYEHFGLEEDHWLIDLIFRTKGM